MTDIIQDLGPYLLGLAAVITAVAGIWKILRDGKSADGSSAVSFNKNLIERVESLETRVGTLEKELADERLVTFSALAFIERLAFLWTMRAEITFPPLPRRLRDRLDSDEWIDMSSPSPEEEQEPESHPS